MTPTHVLAARRLRAALDKAYTAASSLATVRKALSNRKTAAEMACAYERTWALCTRLSAAARIVARRCRARHRRLKEGTPCEIAPLPALEGPPPPAPTPSPPPSAQPPPSPVPSLCPSEGAIEARPMAAQRRRTKRQLADEIRAAAKQ